jgi:hypothetical protein
MIFDRIIRAGWLVFAFLLLFVLWRFQQHGLSIDISADHMGIDLNTDHIFVN